MDDNIQVPPPGGHFLHPSSTPGAPAQPDWVSEIHENCKHEDENVLRNLLIGYRDAGHPSFMARTWVNILEGFENVPHKTPEWRHERTHLLLDYIEGRHRLELLHQAIEFIKAEGEAPFKRPEEDEKMYFVVCQLIRGYPDLAFENFSGKQPAFMMAASQGAVFLVDFALKELRSLLVSRMGTLEEDPLEHLYNKLRMTDPAGNTALGLAVRRGHGDIVRILLEADKGLAGPEYLRDDQIKQAVVKCDIEILTMVLDAQPDIAAKLPELIVRHGKDQCKEMWTAVAPRFENSLQNSEILHLAVQNGKIEIIDWLVRKFPQMVIEKDKWSRIALFYNIDLAKKKEIRRSIVPEIVRRCKPTQMKELLRAANDTPRQASLDLRVFNQDTHDFSDFINLVRELIRTRSDLTNSPDLAPNIIEFESVLRYVHFPDFSRMTLSKDEKRDWHEVPSILLWLHQKGVRSILKLVVPDCRANPLDEDQIRVCLERFEVEELNWRRLDLGIEPIVSLASTLTALHLYSSGNWAVLSHWVSEEGLTKLKKLKELHIIIVKDSMTEFQLESCTKKITDQILHLRSRCGWSWHPVVKIEKWSHGTKLMQRPKGVIDASDPEEKSASSCIKLDAFVRAYTAIQQQRLERSSTSKLKPLRKIKIALIDTGVGGLGEKSQLQIKPGISFGHGADGESESPWWIPSNEHGPQMADIICSIDPYCEIYPVKVTNDADEGAVKASPVIDAINWAVEQGVDIISLSLVLFNSHPDLYNAVSAASQKNILIICSTADRGNNQQKVYPAQYWKQTKTDCLIPIAGCDEYGKLTDWSTETKAKYHFLGKNVRAKSGRVMKHTNKEISGSSVATAIAAGTASLVLACSLLALAEEKVSRKQHIEIFFEKMQTEETREHKLKYVEPAIMFGEERIANNNLETYIKREFRNQIDF